MSEEKEKDPAKVYIIPNNFTDSGKLLNGMLELRNTLEAGCIGGLLYLIEKNTIANTLSDVNYVLVFILTVVPITVLCLIGINGDSITVFLKTCFIFLKNHRKMRFRRIYNEKK